MLDCFLKKELCVSDYLSLFLGRPAISSLGNYRRTDSEPKSNASNRVSDAIIPFLGFHLLTKVGEAILHRQSIILHIKRHQLGTFNRSLMV